MIPLNYHHLYYFYVIARTGSIVKACDTLLLAQPTLSAQLRLLEKSLGATLFNRVKQRLHLTDAGRMVLDYAESIFETGQELQDALRDRPKEGKMAVQVGVVTGTPRSFGHALLNKALDYQDIHHVVLSEGRMDVLLKELREHRLDAVLADWPASGADREFENHLLAKIPIVFAASTALARRYGPLPKGLEGAPLILPSGPGYVSHQINERFAQWKIRPNIIAEVQDVEIARRLALDGRGIAILNAYTVKVSLPAHRLQVVRCQPALDVVEPVYLITRPRRWTNPVVRYLLENFKLAI